MSAQQESDRLDLAVTCPACQSPAGERCTTVSASDRRRPVEWTHSARHDLRMGWT